MILSGSLVQIKGFGFALASAMKRLMASLSSWSERKTPRLRRLLVSFAKKPSTALSQEQEVGVKWKTKRGCLSSQSSYVRMLMGGVVVDDDMDRFLLAGTLASTALRKRMNS